MAVKLSGIAEFLAKHAGELLGITGVFRNILPALPIGAQDKSNVERTLADIEAAAERIGKSAAKVSLVTVKKSDVENAVKAVLPSLVEAEIKRQLALAAKAAETPKE